MTACHGNARSFARVQTRLTNSRCRRAGRDPREWSIEQRDCPQRRIPDLLRQLRVALPAKVDLWVGGGGAARLAAIDGVLQVAAFDAALTALGAWRVAHAGKSP